MNLSLNICIISREYPPDTAFGGIATFSQDTALMLRNQGHQVSVFSQSLTKNYIYEQDGIRVYKIRVPKPFDNYQNLPLFIPAYNTVVMRQVLKEHRKQPFDLIDVPDHLAEGLFSTYLNIPIVTRLHTPFSLIVDLNLNNYKKDLSFILIKQMEKLALNRSTILYAPCMDLVRRCKDLFKINLVPIKIFNYPLDFNIFKPFQEIKISNGKRILFIGRLEQRKGIETIAATFCKLSKLYPDCTLTLVGNDTPNIKGFSSAKSYLKNQFQENECLSQVSFFDPVPISNLPTIFADHDIVWVPSLYDNYPLICLEAMACAKALIVSDAGGLPEIIKHNETGLIFQAGDPDALLIQTLTLIENPHLFAQFGLNARKFIEKNCSSDAIYGSTLDLYTTALKIFESKGGKNAEMFSFRG